MTLAGPTESPKPTNILAEVEKLKHQTVEGAPLDPQLAQLREWQSSRLARTYADLIAKPRFQPAFQFFAEDIYAARDYSQRNHDIERMYAFLQRFLPENVIRPLVLSVQLNHLTEELDQQLLEVLLNRLNWNGSLTISLYAEAYRLCDNYARRVRQIELIHETGIAVDRAVNTPFSGTVLKVAKPPLERAGWSDLVGFMERGYKAFKQMRGANDFLNTIRSRELAILDRIYASHPDPFDIGS